MPPFSTLLGTFIALFPADEFDKKGTIFSVKGAIFSAPLTFLVLFFSVLLKLIFIVYFDFQCLLLSVSVCLFDFFFVCAVVSRKKEAI